MKVIDASAWEKRNLGCNAWEISLDRNDLANIPAMIKSVTASTFNDAYVCVKIPVGHLDALHALEDIGFRFLEVQFEIVDYFDPTELSVQLRRLNLELEANVLPKTRVSWDSVISRITPGMFSTDRIALDPAFGLDVACKRYINWCWDLYKDPNAQLVAYRCQDETIAFNLQIYNAVKRTNDGILGGVFEEYCNDGYGAVVVLDEFGRKMYGKRKTHVSSNNLPVLRLHQRCGRVIMGAIYVLRKLNSSSNV